MDYLYSLLNVLQPDHVSLWLLSADHHQKNPYWEAPIEDSTKY